MPNLFDSLRGVQGLATVESTDLGAALAGAETIARELVDQEHWAHDIFTATPEGARWKAEELTEQLLYQQAYQPQGQMRVLIIAYAHQMDARLHDQLLKVVEEPVAPVLFLFVVANGNSLPTTIQSRIYRRVSIPPRSIEQLTSEITTAAGATPSEDVVQLAQAAPAIAAGLVGESAGEVLPLAEQFLEQLSRPGFTSGWAATAAVKKLAKAASGASQEAPKTKGAQREAIRGGLALLKHTALGALAGGTVDQARAANQWLERIDKAEHLAEAHLPVEQVLVYATTRSGGAV